MALRSSNLLAALGAAVAALLGLLVLQRLGATALGLAAAAVLGLLLLARPGLAAGLLIALVVLLESRPEFVGFPAQTRFYEFVGPKVTGLEALLGLAVAAAVLRASARGRALLPEPFTGPLLLVAVALAFGTEVGLSAGAAGIDVLQAVRTVLPLLLVPFVVVNVLDSLERVRQAALFAFGLVSVKSALGLLLLFGGITPAASDTLSITFYEAPANLLAMVVVLAVLGAVVARVPTGWLVRAGLALCFASLLLSYRRAFWIGTVAALVLVVLVATDRTGRRLLVPAGVVLLAAAALVLSGSTGPELSGPVGERISQLRPSEVKANREDRYRLTEQRNVRAALREHPVDGLGFAVPWPARYPLALENVGGRNYAHFAMTWWWLKCGLLGLLAYLAYMGTTAVSALRSFRLVRDPAVRLALLGIGTGVAGLAVAELTATFTGAEPRTSVIVGAFMGFAAAARRFRDDPSPA